MTIFSKIIAGEIPSYKIAENDKFYAFLDVFPLREGHTLVVPKTEVDKLFDLDDDYLSELLTFAKPIAKAIEAAFKPNRCGLSVIGLEVPHAHMHLVPISSSNDLNFTQPKQKVSEEALKAVQEKILTHLLLYFFIAHRCLHHTAHEVAELLCVGVERQESILILGFKSSEHFLHFGFGGRGLGGCCADNEKGSEGEAGIFHVDV